MTKVNAYEQVTRQMVFGMQEDIKEIKNSLDVIKKSNEQMFNHFTDKYEKMFKELGNRMPGWMTIVITILGSIVSAMAVWAFTGS